MNAEKGLVVYIDRLGNYDWILVKIEEREDTENRLEDSGFDVVGFLPVVSVNHIG